MPDHKAILRLPKNLLPMHHSLGKGLAALITDADNQRISHIKTDLILPNPFQPRHTFDDESLRKLSETIQKDGMLEPILLRKIGEKYQIIAGERRLRAAKLAEFKNVPAIIRQNISDEEMARFALIENLQRKELTCVEEAEGYKKLITQFGYSQQRLSLIIGKDRATIANTVRILNLPGTVVRFLQQRLLSLGHAKILLSVSDEDKQVKYAEYTIKNKLSVRQLESATRKNQQVNLSVHERTYKNYEEVISDFFKLPVTISNNKIILKYKEAAELETIIGKLSLTMKR